jgi:hypothetical protein
VRPALSASAIAREGLTHVSIEKMAKAGLGDDVIVSMIQSEAPDSAPYNRSYRSACFMTINLPFIFEAYRGSYAREHHPLAHFC